LFLLNTSGLSTPSELIWELYKVGKDSLFHLNTFFATPPVSRAEAKVGVVVISYRNQSKELIPASKFHISLNFP
jgi:hypothetical protein